MLNLRCLCLITVLLTVTMHMTQFTEASPSVIKNTNLKELKDEDNSKGLCCCCCGLCLSCNKNGGLELNNLEQSPASANTTLVEGDDKGLCCCCCGYCLSCGKSGAPSLVPMSS